MPSPENIEPSTGTDDARLSLTWFITQTFRHNLPLDAVAAAVGRSVDELAADPERLIGIAGNRLADLLTDAQRTVQPVDVPEVEIIAAGYDATPTLSEFGHAARTAVKAEADTGARTAAGLALAALLAGLRREGINA